MGTSLVSALGSPSEGVFPFSACHLSQADEYHARSIVKWEGDLTISPMGVVKDHQRQVAPRGREKGKQGPF